jgi:hypothetical protein
MDEVWVSSEFEKGIVRFSSKTIRCIFAIVEKPLLFAFQACIKIQVS